MYNSKSTFVKLMLNTYYEHSIPNVINNISISITCQLILHSIYILRWTLQKNVKQTVWFYMQALSVLDY